MQWAPRAPPALAPGLGARGGSKEADGQEGDDESTARFWFPSPVVDPINVPLPDPTAKLLCLRSPSAGTPRRSALPLGRGRCHSRRAQPFGPRSLGLRWTLCWQPDRSRPV